jgi:toxin-antitoxin system PIN domain toxin
MIIPDVNILVYAYDSTSPWHERGRKWWHQTLVGSESVGIPAVVIMAFIRLMTHTSLSGNPMAVSRARVIIDSWMAVDGVRVLAPTWETLSLMMDLLEEAGVGGSLSTDALIAAHALEQRASVWSNDVDFKRFPGVKVRNPLKDLDS